MVVLKERVINPDREGSHGVNVLHLKVSTLRNREREMETDRMKDRQS